MSDTESRFDRSARWQRERKQLPWEEKLRQALAAGESLRGFACAHGGNDADHAPAPPDSNPSSKSEAPGSSPGEPSSSRR